MSWSGFSTVDPVCGAEGGRDTLSSVVLCTMSCGSNNHSAEYVTLYVQEMLEKHQEFLQRQREAVKYRLKKLASRQAEITVGFWLVCAFSKYVCERAVSSAACVSESVLGDKGEHRQGLPGDPRSPGRGPEGHAVSPGDGGAGRCLHPGWVHGEKLQSDPGDRARPGPSHGGSGPNGHRHTGDGFTPVN